MSDLPNAADARHAPLVLVADDDDDTRFLFRTMLGLLGYSVIEARDGEEAVRLAESAAPDLILMDGSLPRLDGFDATRRIRQFGPVGSTPIVFISGYADPAFLALAREAGSDEYLVKPFGFNQLGDILEKYLGREHERCRGTPRAHL